MTYPVDDAGNPRVDFVWGNMAMQPADQREDDSDTLIGINVEQNRGWSGTEVYLAGPLNNDETAYLSVGDQSYDTWWGNPTRRSVAVPTTHTIATTGYSNYPAFIPNYAGDGDADLEVIMPDLSKLLYPEWQSAIQNAGLDYHANIGVYEESTLENDNKLISQTPAAGTICNTGAQVTTERYVAPTVPNLVGLSDPEEAQTALAARALVLGNTNSSTAGATSENNLKVKSQSIAAGTKVAGGTVVDIVVYDYVVDPVNHTIAGIRHNWQGSDNNGQTFFMFLQGQNHTLNNGQQISISGCDVGQYNGGAWVVLASENDNSFNTNGTKVTIYWNGSMSTTADASTGTYTKIN